MLTHGIASIGIGALNPSILPSSTGERHRPHEDISQLTFASVRSEDLVAILISGSAEAFQNYGSTKTRRGGFAAKKYA
jgi:hypothetical protein